MGCDFDLAVNNRKGTVDLVLEKIETNFAASKIQLCVKWPSAVE